MWSALIRANRDVFSHTDTVHPELSLRLWLILDERKKNGRHCISSLCGKDGDMEMCFPISVVGDLVKMKGLLIFLFCYDFQGRVQQRRRRHEN